MVPLEARAVSEDGGERRGVFSEKEIHGNRALGVIDKREVAKGRVNLKV